MEWMSLVWVILCLFLFHILYAQDLILANQVEPNEKLSAFIKGIDISVDEEEFSNQMDQFIREMGFICQTNSGFDFGYTCNGYPMVEIIISYFPNMFTFLVFGLASPLVFLIGLFMFIPVLIALRFSLRLFKKVAI